MSDTRPKTDPEVAEAVDETIAESLEAHESAHPSDGFYIVVALILAFVTALEVSTYFVDFGDVALPVLFVLMVIKFAMVVAFFMHLRFDSSLFRRVFVSGLFLAVGVYLAALSTFRFFG
ncbi:MAG TPA: cytochrome C oxidase subunit IV family protein [Acidimicrobiales bacterium]|jgi:cytochrome c oxidase subunit 4